MDQELQTKIDRIIGRAVLRARLITWVGAAVIGAVCGAVAAWWLT